MSDGTDGDALTRVYVWGEMVKSRNELRPLEGEHFITLRSKSLGDIFLCTLAPGGIDKGSSELRG
jgi:hypothetical protein